jgi:hypothetical protein
MHKQHFLIVLMFIMSVLLSTSSVANGEQGVYRHAIDDPMGLQKSKVLEMHDVYSFYGTDIYPPSITRMLNLGAAKMTGYDDPQKAWGAIISKDDIVALKFNDCGVPGFSWNYEFLDLLLQNFYQLGYKKENFLIVGIYTLPNSAIGTRIHHYGWEDDAIFIGSDLDFLPRWLKEVTAIINIPNYMDDNIIGIRGCLANLSWSMVKQPARLYQNKGDNGDPFIAEINALPPIRNKVRLHIVNALQVLYYGGPQHDTTFQVNHQSILMSFDPVALDHIGIEYLRRYRKTKTMPQKLPPPLYSQYLTTAELYGLGYYNFTDISYEKINPNLYIDQY